MTATLPAVVQSVFDRFITTELTTIDRLGQPITWPVTPYYTLGGPYFEEYRDCEYADEWRRERQAMLRVDQRK